MGSQPTLADFMQGGHEQVAAGYILYGSSTILVYTTGHSVNGFTYDVSVGEFILSHPDIKSPATGAIYSCNEGQLDRMPGAVQQYIRQCRTQEFTARYIGSLVADFHRNLLKGGIYLYPPTPASPNGKLRLLYECYPLAFIAERAGLPGHQPDGVYPGYRPPHVAPACPIIYRHGIDGSGLDGLFLNR